MVRDPGDQLDADERERLAVHVENRDHVEACAAGGLRDVARGVLLGFGRHPDVVGELKALVDFRDGQDAGSGRLPSLRAKASVCASVELAPPMDDG